MRTPRQAGKGQDDMDHIKIIFFDIDGTLVDPETRQVSAKTMQLLRRLRQRGTLICLATGRSPVALPNMEGIVFDAYLTFNGSLCYTPKETVYSNPIPTEMVDKLIGNAAALGRPVSVATRQGLFANGIDQDLADYYKLANLELTVAEDFAEASRREVYQIMLGCREEDFSSVLRHTAGVKIAVSWDRAVDVIPADSGKEVGIQRILGHFGLSRAEALAFGDGNNDIEMLTTVGTGVAMANASPRLKAVADAVCGHVAQDGVYYYCLQHGLI